MPKNSRRKSREDAVVLLYQKDLLSKKLDMILEDEIFVGNKYDEFTLKLLRGVDENKIKIDKMITEIVVNWTLDRIAIIDRNILRVAIYEILFEEDIPLKVSVDEAIEIAKRLGQKDDTPKFINGVLGKILNNISN